MRGGGPAGPPRAAAADWEGPCFARPPLAHRLAGAELDAVEQRLHAQRWAGYVAVGWRERTLVTRFGEVRVRRGLYRAPDGAARFLLDEHLGWPAGQAATPDFAALLVDWASDVPFRAAARRMAQATARVVSGSATWRLLQQVAQRVTAQEQATHPAWAATAALPTPRASGWCRCSTWRPTGCG